MTLGNAFLAEVPNWLQMPLLAARRFIFIIIYKVSAEERKVERLARRREQRNFQTSELDRYQRPSSLGHTPGFRGAGWPRGGGGVLEEEVSTFLPVSARSVLLL